MVRYAKTIGAALLAAVLLGQTALAAQPERRFDFERDDGGFVPIFADYPAGEGVDAFYELEHAWTALPAGDGKGLYLSGNNHSGDLFMGYYKEISGLTVGQLYEFQAAFRLATNVDGGRIGVGGSPGSSVFVKGGIAAEKPQRSAAEQNTYRLNVHKGNQGVGSCDMLLLGNLEKEAAQHPGAYEWKQFSFTMQARASADGCVYLILGTDSGFEATSTYYLDDVTLSWSERQETAITRGDAIRRMYDDVLPAAAAAPAFADVGPDSPYCAAVGWAQARGLVSGYGAGCFGAADVLTVPQALTILYRYAGSPAVRGGAELADRVPVWAADAAAWALQSGRIPERLLTNGGVMSSYDFVRA